MRQRSPLVAVAAALAMEVAVDRATGSRRRLKRARRGARLGGQRRLLRARHGAGRRARRARLRVFMRAHLRVAALALAIWRIVVL